MKTYTRAAFEPLRPRQVVLVLVFLVVSGWYLAWRPSTFNPGALAFSITVYAAEVYGLVTVLLHLFMVWRLRIRVAPPAPEGFLVDVFITTINEPASMVRRTLLAATRMDYPHTTWLLDDGDRADMKILAEELGVRYLAREKTVDAKAGNLNNGLAHSRAELVAVFDADHAPRRDFLMETLGYFSDPAVAFVQTPQDFYNLDSFQHREARDHRHIWTEQSLFFRVIQRGKDCWNSAFFCGSCAVLRRSSLDAIGGFATGTVTEDLHTSIRLHKRGYVSIYHPRSLAFGIAPSTLRPFLRQRIRWGQGAMQVWWQEGVVFTRGLTLPQRLNYLASMLTYFDGWQKAVFYAAPVIVLVTGIMPIAALNAEFLIRFIPFYILTFWVFEEIGRGFGRSVLIEQYNMARFAAFAWSTLTGGLGTRNFQVTAKAIGGRDGSMHYAAPQAGALTLNLLAIPVGVALFFQGGHLPLGGLVANCIWASVNAALAAATLSFTRRRDANRRRDYRFPIPLPYRLLNGEGGEQLGVVDDLSSSGCRLYGRFVNHFQVGSILDAELFLPHRTLLRRLAVSAVTRGRSDGRPYVKAVGCRFLLRTAAERDALDGFLYGSDLQWGVRSLTERTATPLEWLREPRAPEEPAADGAHHWAPARVRQVQASHTLNDICVALLDASGEPRRLLAFAPLPEGKDVFVSVHTAVRIAGYRMQFTAAQRLDCPLGPVYLYSNLQRASSPRREPLLLAHQRLGPSLSPA